MKEIKDIPDIKHLFEPSSVAVIGASHNPEKIGYRLLENIVKGGYKGHVYPINPKGGEILKQKVYASITDVDGNVDIALISIPSGYVFEAIEVCAEKGVRFAVIITSGFSEVGNTKEEKRIVSFARDNGMRILGPNVFGIYSSSVMLNATFGPEDINPGSVAIVSQSGAIGAAMIGKTKAENIGISSIVSVGNKADIDESDLIDYFISHSDTKIILMYIEGVRKGERLVHLLRTAAGKKPVVVIKSGRSKRGALAAASHTGSLAGADEVFDDIMRQCGVLRAESIQDALEWSRFLAYAPLPEGDNTVIITNGGGIGVMCADACEKYNVPLYDNIQAMKEIFSGVVPEFGSIKNPVDLTGQATASDYDSALKAAMKDPGIHSVICLACETAVFNVEKFAEVVEKNYIENKSAKPVIFSVFGGERVEDITVILRKKGVPIYNDVYGAVSCLGALFYYRYYNMTPPDVAEGIPIDIKKIESAVKKARAEKRFFLFPHESREIMNAAGILLPESRIARTLQDCIMYSEEIGYPVALKIVSRDIIHKSDVGGVALHLDNRDEAVEAYEAILHNCRNNRPDAFIEGIEVSKMIKSGIETIIGARRDRSFGPIVMFGLGGIYVEIMKDVSFRAFPVSRSGAMRMISETRSYPLLLGVRGEKMKDVDAIADTIIRVGSLLHQSPGITDIEINPLVVFDQGEGVKAVDVRILLKKPEEVV